MRMLAYTRVSSDEQAKSGLGLEAQKQAIGAAVEGRDVEICQLLVDDGYSGKNLKRPGIQEGLTLLGAGRADGIIATHLDRFSRDVLDTATLRKRAEREGWLLYALDQPVDPATATGDLNTNINASVSQHYRKCVGERTRQALAALRAQGKRLGRPSTLPASTIKRIQRAVNRGDSYKKIADSLNKAKVPTADDIRYERPLSSTWCSGTVWVAINAKKRAKKRAEKIQRPSLAFQTMNGMKLDVMAAVAQHCAQLDVEQPRRRKEPTRR